MRRFLRSLGSFLVSALVFLLMLEAACFVAIRAGWFEVEMPSYTLGGADWFWKVLSPDFGVWHEPNDMMVHSRRCFEAVYRSNAFGMRDAETARDGDRHRVVVLGDSFVEGWGVDYGARFTEILEEKDGVELLNFGTSGSFGPTQSYILYKTLASGFAHDAVILAILPDNDFSDDTPYRRKLGAHALWRPFLVGSYPDYTLTYPDRAFEPDRRSGLALDVLMEEFWISYRVLKYYGAYLVELTDRWSEAPERGPYDYYAGYYDYGKNQFRRLRYVIEQIKAVAGARPMLVVTIPRETDMRRWRETGAEPPIRQEMGALSAELGIDYIDLMPGMEAATARYFHACDGHWSPEGHAKVAEIIGGWDYFGSR